MKSQVKPYRLDISKKTKHRLRQAPKRIATEISEAILDLRFDPYPVNSKELGRELAGWRSLRIDGWRVIYAVNEADKIVKVLAVRPRDAQTYLDFP
jgi:mRNA-degrading endonuclease RelE of RelBE toxin-antitoxin system